MSHESEAPSGVPDVRRSQEHDQPGVFEVLHAAVQKDVPAASGDRLIPEGCREGLVEKVAAGGMKSSNSECPIRSSLVNPRRSRFRTRNITAFALCCGLLTFCFLASPHYVPHRTHVDGVLCYLDRAERKERDVWFADDYRIAWLTVKFAADGRPDPWGFAFWHYLGIHFEEYPAKLEALRRAQLGSEYAAWYGESEAGANPGVEGRPAPASSAKKPPQSERRLKGRRAA